jgi:hypothetical protein
MGVLGAFYPSVAPTQQPMKQTLLWERKRSGVPYIYNDFPACPGVLDKKCYRGKTKGIVNEDNYPQVLKGSTL